MTDTLTRFTAEADQLREEAFAELARLGDAVEAAEEALAQARHKRLEYACDVAESKLVPKEDVWVAARMARTTLFNGLGDRRDVRNAEVAAKLEKAKA